MRFSLSIFIGYWYGKYSTSLQEKGKMFKPRLENGKLLKILP